MDSVSSLFEASGPTTLTWFYQVPADCIIDFEKDVQSFHDPSALRVRM